MMQRLLLFLLLTAASLQARDELRYTIIETPYLFSTYYELIGDHGYEGRVVQGALHINTTYELYDTQGDYAGKGVCRLLSLGAFCSWAREIDLYDHAGAKIGLIEGKTLTTASAKFCLYGPDGALVAIAYQDRAGAGINLVTADKLERPLGFLKREYTLKEASDWHVVLYDTATLDPRLLKIFSAFIIDCQDDL